MIFSRLFKKRTRLTSDAEDQNALVLVVQGDDDIEVRLAACRKIRRLSSLREIASSSEDLGLRDTAQARYGELLCGQGEGAVELQERLEEIAAIEAQPVLEQVALKGQEAELRHAAITKIKSPETLARCALADSLAANRHAAVRLLENKQALERVVKGIGKKDKQVYRLARHKLRDLADQQARSGRIAAECDALCEKLERLGRLGHWVQDRAYADVLDRQWALLAPEADDGRRARYRSSRMRFLSAYEDYRRDHEAQIAAEEAQENLRAERCLLLEELRALSSQDDAAKVSQDLDRIAQRWDEMDSLQPEDQAGLERDYSEARTQVTGHLDQLSARERSKDRIKDLQARAEEMMQQDKPIKVGAARVILQEAKRLLQASGPENSTAAGLQAVLEALEAHLREQRRQAGEQVAGVSARLDELEGALESGRLKEADPLYRAIAASIDFAESSGLGTESYAQLQGRLRALAPRLRELQKWRKWGTDQHRQELCDALEALVHKDIGLEDMGARLRELQDGWRELDRGGQPSNQALWGRFQAAANRVREHCKPYLEEQVAEREANLRQREQLCDELEAFVEQVDWERVDWKKTMRAEVQMRQAWSAIGPVEARQRRGLERRFRQAKGRLDSHLARERERNQAHKLQLIAQVEALCEEPDLRQAIEQTKRLQQQWHTTVPARQGEENRLWRRFRAACDAVFERRRQQQETQSATLTENLRRREALCAEMEGLSRSQLDTRALTEARQALEQRWRDCESLPLPRNANIGLVKRWRAAGAKVDVSLGRRSREQELAELQLLAARAELCERLERSLQEGGLSGGALRAIESEWRAMPDQSDVELQGAVQRRFDDALQALSQGEERSRAWRDRLESNGQRRAEICLHLEILGQVDSPAELTEQRLQLQVERLAERMREGKDDAREFMLGLLRQWYLCGPAPASTATYLQDRFSRARAAIERAEQNADH